MQSNASSQNNNNQSDFLRVSEQNTSGFNRNSGFTNAVYNSHNVQSEQNNDQKIPQLEDDYLDCVGMTNSQEFRKPAQKIEQDVQRLSLGVQQFELSTQTTVFDLISEEDEEEIIMQLPAPTLKKQNAMNFPEAKYTQLEKQQAMNFEKGDININVQNTIFEFKEIIFEEELNISFPPILSLKRQDAMNFQENISYQGIENNKDNMYDINMDMEESTHVRGSDIGYYAKVKQSPQKTQFAREFKLSDQQIDGSIENQKFDSPFDLLTEQQEEDLFMYQLPLPDLKKQTAMNFPEAQNAQLERQNANNHTIDKNLNVYHTPFQYNQEQQEKLQDLENLEIDNLPSLGLKRQNAYNFKREEFNILSDEIEDQVILGLQLPNLSKQNAMNFKEAQIPTLERQQNMNFLNGDANINVQNSPFNLTTQMNSNIQFNEQQQLDQLPQLTLNRQQAFIQDYKADDFLDVGMEESLTIDATSNQLEEQFINSLPTLTLKRQHATNYQQEAFNILHQLAETYAEDQEMITSINKALQNFDAQNYKETFDNLFAMVQNQDMGNSISQNAPKMFESINNLMKSLEVADC